jgi:exosome complex exonuclease DIS3/RRP44
MTSPLTLTPYPLSPSLSLSLQSVIRSKASLTYDEAQSMLDEPQRSDAISCSVRLLNALARRMRQRRIAAGALTLASPEVKFKFDSETQSPVDVCMYSLKEANALVEEWMLLANITVAKKTLRHFPTLSVLRRHAAPSLEQLLPLEEAAAAAGVSLDTSSSKALADSLDRAHREGDAYFNTLLRVLATRCMMPAQYLCSGEVSKEQFHHYGLAAPVYTHFTSPIRRYADILVHRLLAAAIQVAPLPAANADRAKQREQCAHMNRRHRAAQYAQRASVNMHTILFFMNNSCREAAYVLSVNRDRVSVLVPRFGIEACILLEALRTALAEKGGRDVASLEAVAAAHSCAVVHRTSGAVLLSLDIFQKVEVHISVKKSATSSNSHLAIALVSQGLVLD